MPKQKPDDEVPEQKPDDLAAELVPDPEKLPDLVNSEGVFGKEHSGRFFKAVCRSEL